MYDFTIQEKMLETSLTLLDENNIKDITALGGGTALSAYYWNHRYSTDIDMFIYDTEDKKGLLRPNKWSDTTKQNMQSIGYDGDFKFQTIYVEFALDKNYKMQFFDVKPFTKIPYTKVKLWDIEINIESIEEIIAKKINYRCEKGNARDLFDIAIAIHKKPDILNHLGRLKQERIGLLYETVKNINNSKELLDSYISDIKEMNPKAEYLELSLNTIKYLDIFLENYCSAYDMGIVLDYDECILIDKMAINPSYHL